MTHPAPTFTQDDMSDTLVFNQSGSPTFVLDQHGTLAFEGDQVNNELVKANNTGIVTAAQQEFSGACWFKVPSLDSDTFHGELMSQFNLSDTDEFFYFIRIMRNAGDDKGRIEISAWSSSTNRTDSRSNLAFDDDQWHRLGWSFDGSLGNNNAQAKIFISGEEVAYDTKDADFGVTGFVGTPGTQPELFIGTIENNSAVGRLDGLCGRVRLWNGTVLSAEQFLDEFNEEITLLDIPPVTPARVGGSSAGVYSNVPKQASSFKVPIIRSSVASSNENASTESDRRDAMKPSQRDGASLDRG